MTGTEAEWFCLEFTCRDYIYIYIYMKKIVREGSGKSRSQKYFHCVGERGVVLLTVGKGSTNL